MTNWKQNLSRIQEIFIRTFLTIIGMALLIIAFYGVSIEELQLTEKDFEFGTQNYLLCTASAICIWVALDLGRFSKLIDAIGQTLGIKKN